MNVRLFLLVLLLLSFTRVCLAENTALLIGVGKYKIADVNLPGIDTDIARMRDVAKALGYTKIHELRDTDATREHVVEKIKNLLQKGISPNDHVLLYFTGHGSQVPDESGDETDDHADEVLILHDVAVNHQAKKLVGGYLLDDTVGELLAGIHAKSIAVFIDACHSGTATKSLRVKAASSSKGADGLEAIQKLLHQQAEEPTYKNKYFEYEGMPEKRGAFAVERAPGASGSAKSPYVAISASQDNESAIATTNGSLFTQGVYETIMAARSKGQLSAVELKNQVAGLIRQRAQQNNIKTQTPNLTGNPELANKNLFLAQAGSTRPSPASSSSAQHNAQRQRPGKVNAWQELEQLVAQRKYAITLAANKQKYAINDYMTVTVAAPKDGYLNVLNVDTRDNDITILYPNKYHRNNKVSGNAKIHIPAKGDAFSLRARGPAGRNLIVALHSVEPINLYEASNSKDVLAVFSSDEEKGLVLRTIKRKDKEAGGKQFGAEKIIVDVH